MGCNRLMRKGSARLGRLLGEEEGNRRLDRGSKAEKKEGCRDKKDSGGVNEKGERKMEGDGMGRRGNGRKKEKAEMERE